MYRDCDVARPELLAYTTHELGRRPGMMSNVHSSSISYVALSEGGRCGSVAAVHEASLENS